MVDEDVLVADRLLAHVGQQQPVLLVLAQLGRVGPEHARPQRREQLALLALLLVRLADHGPGQVQELPVDGLEQAEQRRRVRQLAVDALLEHGQELVEGALQRPPRALRPRLPEQARHHLAERVGLARPRLEQPDPAQGRVQVVEHGPDRVGRLRRDVRELALGPFHDDEDAERSQLGRGIR